MSVSAPPPFAPAMTAFAVDLYNWLGPVAGQDADYGYPLAGVCGGVGEMFRQVEEVCRAQPGRDPWQQATDIDNCPDWLVPWLGQLVGVQVTLSAGPDAQRTQVKAELGFGRGRPATLVSAVQSTLIGTQKVTLLERAGGDAWALTIITDPSETPDVTATTTAATGAKAAALGLTLLQSAKPYWIQGTRTYVAAPATYVDALVADVT